MPSSLIPSPQYLSLSNAQRQIVMNDPWVSHRLFELKYPTSWKLLIALFDVSNFPRVSEDRARRMLARLGEYLPDIAVNRVSHADTLPYSFDYFLAGVLRIYRHFAGSPPVPNLAPLAQFLSGGDFACTNLSPRQDLRLEGFHLPPADSAIVTEDPYFYTDPEDLGEDSGEDSDTSSGSDSNSGDESGGIKLIDDEAEEAEEGHDSSGSEDSLDGAGHLLSPRPDKSPTPASDEESEHSPAASFSLDPPPSDVAFGVSGSFRLAQTTDAKTFPLKVEGKSKGKGKAKAEESGKERLRKAAVPKNDEDHAFSRYAKPETQALGVLGYQSVAFPYVSAAQADTLSRATLDRATYRAQNFLEHPVLPMGPCVQCCANRIACNGNGVGFPCDRCASANRGQCSHTSTLAQRRAISANANLGLPLDPATVEIMGYEMEAAHAHMAATRMVANDAERAYFYTMRRAIFHGLRDLVGVSANDPVLLDAEDSARRDVLLDCATRLGLDPFRAPRPDDLVPPPRNEAFPVSTTILTPLDVSGLVPLEEFVNGPSTSVDNQAQGSSRGAAGASSTSQRVHVKRRRSDEDVPADVKAFLAQMVETTAPKKRKLSSDGATVPRPSLLGAPAPRAPKSKKSKKKKAAAQPEFVQGSSKQVPRRSRSPEY
ncbi:hypothetical protein DFH09DRAFT_1312648 [Mycena vulgaris]|nr:hypothetical protein DFH09DRAFT_1312648 [Mycena vulgaris]